MFTYRKSTDANIHLYDFQGQWKCQGLLKTIILESRATELSNIDRENTNPTLTKKHVLKSTLRNPEKFKKAVSKENQDWCHQFFKILNTKSIY